MQRSYSSLLTGHRARFEGLEADSDVTGGQGVTQVDDRPLDATLRSCRRTTPQATTRQQTDSYRMSVATLEDSPDVDLDSILGELCALESQFEKEIGRKQDSTGAPQKHTAIDVGGKSGSCQRQTTTNIISSGAGTVTRSSSCKLEMTLPAELPWTSDTHEKGRTDSPDDDSAFSDSVSMLSSESSASSGGGGVRGHVSSKSCTSAVSCTSSTVSSASSSCDSSSSRSQAEQAARLKAEKIRLALDKIREANIKKLFIKVFCENGETKRLLVDETMNVAQVTSILAAKTRVTLDPRWAIVEYLPHLMMERVYEDHENLVENLMLWTRDSKNQLIFQERPDKCDLFSAPHIVLFPAGDQHHHAPADQQAKMFMVQEFFSSTHVSPVPALESELWLKVDGKKAWRRHHFVLRASGIYYSPKGKSRCAKDLLCLCTFDMNQIYHGIGWRKKFKSPTDFCMAIKHSHIQCKAPKHIRYLCADDPTTMRRWIMAFRIAKWGRQLVENYKCCSLNEVSSDEHIECLAQARRFSLASDKPGSSSSSSSCSTGGEIKEAVGSDVADSLSDRSSVCSRASSSGGGSCKCSPDLAFDIDQPQGGTIRRRPPSSSSSSTTLAAPKLPLTSTTRLLVKAEQQVKLATPPLPAMTSPAVVMTSHSPCGTLKQQHQLRLLRPHPTMNPAVSREDSVPAPPPSSSSCDTELLACQSSLTTASSLSLSSLPPPPPECPAHFDTVCDTSNSSRTSSPLPPPPPLPAPLSPRCESPLPAVPAPMPHIEPVYGECRVQHDSAVPGTTQQRRTRRITFGATTEIPANTPPPPPPKRSQTTRLTCQPTVAQQQQQQQQDEEMAGAPQFMRDLQRVMHKKWALAEKCKLDFASPQHVLGFREQQQQQRRCEDDEDEGGGVEDSTGPATARGQHVDAWLRQHYGARPAAPHVVYDMPRASLRRMPPPAPPRRDESTHLSSSSSTGTR